MIPQHKFIIPLLCGLLFITTSGVVSADKEMSFSRRVEQAPTRMRSLPTGEKIKTLLDTYKPRVYVSPKSYLPMSFYQDYLPNTVLKNNQGNTVKANVDQRTLAQFANRNDHYLDYLPSENEALQFTLQDVHPGFYGRAYADTLTHSKENIPLLFLKYSTVFPFSGLPDGNAWWKNAASWLAGNPWGWHELDIHGAVYVILHRPSMKPIGTMLSQHNHQRVHLRGRDFQWPQTNRITVSYAVRSNEPYLLTETMRSRLEPTVGNPNDIEALYEKTWIRPTSAGYDRIIAPEDGAREVPMTLTYLDPDNPLYTSHMDLGDRRLLFGYWRTWFRDGPPGIDYYAPPPLKNLADLAAFWDIDEEDQDYFTLLKKLEDKPRTERIEQLLTYQKPQFVQNLKRVLNGIKISP